MATSWKFTDNSAAVKKQLLQVSQSAMEAACLIVEGAAKANAPVGTSGELRDKIDHRITKSGGIITGQIGSPTDYAIYVEYGTGEFAENGAGRKGGWSYQTPDGEWHHTDGMQPQPFLRPAFRENKKNIENVIGREFKSTFNGK